VDLNSVVSLVLFGAVALMLVVRRRSKRADRRRDAREAQARERSSEERSRY